MRYVQYIYDKTTQCKNLSSVLDVCLTLEHVRQRPYSFNTVTSMSDFRGGGGLIFNPIYELLQLVTSITNDSS
jgi:hypothetical protein